MASSTRARVPADLKLEFSTREIVPMPTERPEQPRESWFSLNYFHGKQGFVTLSSELGRSFSRASLPRKDRPSSDDKVTKPLFAMEVVPKKTTIREVARAASVGIGTISRVLNSSSQVSRERVRACLRPSGVSDPP